ncbi:hypothetical protein, partial [Puia dinghuensis]|uniref:hypothetical protein n=1 Tax=Puia dinghuensis TaxID=1792502 RepID=UPI00166B8E12
MQSNLTNTLDVLKEAGKRGLVFFLEEGKLKYKKSRRTDTDQLFMEEVARHREEILRLLQEREAAAEVDWAGIVRQRQQMERPPLSFNQERLWFVDRLEGSRHYHMPWAVRLKGLPDEALLERSFRAVIHRH